MKKILAILMCLMLFTGFSVSAAEPAMPVTLENLRVESGQVLGDLRIAADSNLTGIQMGVSYNGTLLKDLTITSDRSFFSSYSIKENGNCPLVSFTNERKVTKAGVFATISFTIESGIILTAEDLPLPIYLLPRDQMTSDYIPPTPPTGDGDGSSGGGGGGTAPSKPKPETKPETKPDAESKIVSSYSAKDNSGNWEKHEDGSWKFTKDGEAASGWNRVDGKWYFFAEDSGKMKTGWVQDKGKWYFTNFSGEMKTGWVQDKGKWYFTNPSGEMKTGWVQDKGKWYFTNPSGEMKTGWVQDKGKWYFTNPSGEMKTGWVQDKGKWYYLKQDGQLITGGKTPDGFRVDASGAWVK